jgi:hypothetical protein
MSLITDIEAIVEKYEQADHLYEEQAAAMELMDKRREILATLYRLEKLEAVAGAAEDFINSDGDYFAWTEDERHCMSRLRDAVLTLKEGET